MSKIDEFPERLARAFRAACGDLKPGGRLPEGMDSEKATRAVLAYIGLRIHEMNESLLDAIEGVNGPEWGEQMRSELGPNLPPSQLSPEQAAAWMRDQDLAMLRDVMARTLETYAAEDGLAEVRGVLLALANDLDHENPEALGRLTAAYEAARSQKGDTDGGA